MTDTVLVAALPLALNAARNSPLSRALAPPSPLLPSELL